MGLCLICNYICVSVGGRVPFPAGPHPPAGQEQGGGGPHLRQHAHGQDRLPQPVTFPSWYLFPKGKIKVKKIYFFVVFFCLLKGVYHEIFDLQFFP